MVVYNKSTLPDETGMSVFHPNYNTAACSMYVGMYGSVPFSKEYQAYVREYSELSKGGGAVYRSDAEKEDRERTVEALKSFGLMYGCNITPFRKTASL